MLYSDPGSFILTRDPLLYSDPGSFILTLAVLLPWIEVPWVKTCNSCSDPVAQSTSSAFPNVYF